LADKGFRVGLAATSGLIAFSLPEAGHQSGGEIGVVFAAGPRADAG
jgi:hypothetical protein